MHVNARKIALAGVLTALATVLLTLSSVIETNSLFLIAAASFCVGIVIREWGLRYGVAFVIASTLVSTLVVPNKFYCITYAGMGIYLMLSEWLWNKIAETSDIVHRVGILWGGRYVVFNCIYLPVLFFFQELLFVKEMSGELLLVFALGGQIMVFVYEKAYAYFQATIWGKLRTKLL